MASIPPTINYISPTHQSSFPDYDAPIFLFSIIFSVVFAVAQAGKDFTYLVVIIAGFAVAGFLFWSVGSEFFSQNSPSVVYSRALKRVKADPRVGCACGSTQ